MTVSQDWGSAAEEWETRSDFIETMQADVTAAMLEGLALSPGERAVEFGAGTGAFAVRLADAVGPGGRVLATDVSPGMVAVIERASAGRPQLSAAVADATAPGLADSGYDAVASRMVLMLLADPVAALAGWHRLLRPGGRLATAVWDAPAGGAAARRARRLHPRHPAGRPGDDRRAHRAAPGRRRLCHPRPGAGRHRRCPVTSRGSVKA